MAPPPWLIALIVVAIAVGVYFYMQQPKTDDTLPTEPTEPAPTSPTEPTEPTEPTTPSADAVIKIDGLVGWWDGPSYDLTQRTWKDKSDKKNDIKEITGLLKKSKNGEEVQGDTDSVVAFPEELYDDEYTFISVAKYDGASKKRIFTGVTGDNFVLGFYGTHSGVYHVSPGGWQTQNTNRHGDDWTLSVIQPKLYRSNGVLRTAFRNPENEDTTPVPARITINGWPTEKSDWSVKEMILYDRNLKPEEYLAIEKALVEKYTTVKPKRYDVSILTGDASEATWPGIVGDVQFRCGKNEALTEFGVNANKKPIYGCMSGLDLDGDEVPGQTIYEDIMENSQYFKNLQNKKIDCGESPINAVSLAMNDDEEKIRYEYTCNNSKVKPNTCQTIYGDAYATGTSFDNVSGLTNTKCPAQHVITAVKLIPDPTDATKQKWELTCCKPKGI